MHVDAVGASVYLGNPEKDEVDQFLRQTGIVSDILMNSIQNLRCLRRDIRPNKAG